MPLYIHEDTVSGKQVEILRSFDLYKEEPTREEAIEKGLTPEEAEVAVWRKILGTGIKMVRGASWGGGKGYWTRGDNI